jgi:hypothetical protein
MRSVSNTARWLPRAAAIVTAALIGAVVCPGVSARAPRLQVKNEVIDLGTLEMGDPAEVRFELRNVGDAPLTIYSANPG